MNEEIRIFNERAVPARFKTATVKVNYQEWLDHLERYATLRDMFAKSIGAPPQASSFPAKCAVAVEVSKSAIAAELKAGRSVPGADFKMGEQRLVRE